MGNSDFDFFSLIKILVKNKIAFAIILIISSVSIFIFLHNTPNSFTVDFSTKSELVNQNEIFIKANQIKKLIEEKSFKQLSDILNVNETELEKIIFFNSSVEKSSPLINNFLFSSSSKKLTDEFPFLLVKYFKEDVFFNQKVSLRKSQLEYNIDKLYTELDSIKKIETNSNNYILLNEKNLNSLLKDLNSYENELLFLDIVILYDGFFTIEKKISSLYKLISSIGGGFSIAIILIFSFYFLKNIKKITL